MNKMMRTGISLLVAGYWLALFVATHLPHVPAPFATPGADKWEHLGAYGTLGVSAGSPGQVALAAVGLEKVSAESPPIVALYGRFSTS